LRQVLTFRRSVLFAGCWLAAFACGGQQFSSVDETSAGSAGRSIAGATSGASGDGDGATSGVDVGGKPSGGKAAGGAAGHGGVIGVAGSAGRAAAGAGGGAGRGGSAGNGGNGGSGGVITVTPPIPLEGLELWFKADAGVTAVSDVVAKWEDASGHARHALQTATNLRPVRDAHGLHDKPAIVFDGTDDYLKLPALPANFEKGLSAFLVAQQDADVDDGGCAGFFEASNGSEIDDIHIGVWQGAMQYEVFDQELHPTDYPVLIGAPELLGVVHQPSTAVQFRRNSNSLGEAQVPLPVTIERNQVYLGHTAYANCLALPGRLSEVLLYSRAVSDDELVGIESYLQKKWGCCTD
jgi:hypothetical protein